MLEIRQAVSQDLSRILLLYRQLHPRDPSTIDASLTETWQAILADEHQQLLVLVDNGVVQATAALFIMKNLSRGGRPAAYLENLVVDEQCRGQNYGHLLVEEAMARARAAGAYKFFLLTGTINREESVAVKERRHRFYRQCGLRDDIKTAFIVYLAEDV